MYNKKIAIITVLAITLAGCINVPPLSQQCNEKCLNDTMDNFIQSVLTKNYNGIPLSEKSEIRENIKQVQIKETIWSKVKDIKSNITFSDELTGNIVARTGVVLSDNRIGYISTRLKVINDRITDVELSADTSDHVISDYVFNLNIKQYEPLPVEQRSSRIELETIARRYFQVLTDHTPLKKDFSESCNRFHSGQQITNVETNSVEEGGPKTCYSSVAGTPPWGPSLEHRFPVIDVERGVVLGITLLISENVLGSMYVSEIIKIVDGKIVHIDNIGLFTKQPTLGFTH